MIKISFKSKDLNKLNFFNSDTNLSLGEAFFLPGGAECRILSGFEKGIDVLSMVSFILENINSISIGLFSAYIYDKLKPQKIDTIEIDGKEIPLEKEAIRKVLEEYKKSND